MLQLTPRLVALFAVVAVLAAGPQVRRRLAPVLVVLAMVIPRPLLTLVPNFEPHVGIAPASLGLDLASAVLLAALLMVRRYPVRPWIALAGTGFVLSMAVGLATWGVDSRHLSGALLLVVAWLAFGFGSTLAGAGWLTGPRYRWLSWTLCGVLTIEVVVTLLQSLGVKLMFADVVSDVDFKNRAFGTFDHPSTVGKFCALALVIVLPGFRSADRTQRRLSGYAVLASFVATGLSQSRANSVALAAAVGLWWFLHNLPSQARRVRKRWNARTAVIAAVALLVVLPALALTLQRSSEDTGAVRTHLMEVGLPFVRAGLVSGLGVNSYVEIVGQLDSVTARGYPIHNTFLLLLSELGLAGAALFFFPIAATCTAAFRRVFHDTEMGTWSRSYLSCLPGIVVIAATGWGMASGTTVICWYLVTGTAYGAVTYRARSSLNVTPSPPVAAISG